MIYDISSIMNDISLIMYDVSLIIHDIPLIIYDISLIMHAISLITHDTSSIIHFIWLTIHDVSLTRFRHYKVLVGRYNQSPKYFIFCFAALFNWQLWYPY